VRTRENRKPDYLHVFLQRRADDHFRRLAQAGVDHFHASIAQGTSDYLGAAVMSVEPGLSDENADFCLGHRRY